MQSINITNMYLTKHNPNIEALKEAQLSLDALELPIANALVHPFNDSVNYIVKEKGYSITHTLLQGTQYNRLIAFSIFIVKHPDDSISLVILNNLDGTIHVKSAPTLTRHSLGKNNITLFLGALINQLHTVLENSYLSNYSKMYDCNPSDFIIQVPVGYFTGKYLNKLHDLTGFNIVHAEQGYNLLPLSNTKWPPYTCHKRLTSLSESESNSLRSLWRLQSKPRINGIVYDAIRQYKSSSDELSDQISMLNDALVSATVKNPPSAFMLNDLVRNIGKPNKVVINDAVIKSHDNAVNNMIAKEYFSKIPYVPSCKPIYGSITNHEYINHFPILSMINTRKS